MSGIQHGGTDGCKVAEGEIGKGAPLGTMFILKRNYKSTICYPKSLGSDVLLELEFFRI